MRIGLINIGDEILLGKIRNSNAFDLAEWVRELGHELVFNLVIGDRLESIADALRNAIDPNNSLHCEYLILTGGLGPTQDDLTRDAVASFLQTTLEFSSEAENWMSERYKIHAVKISEGQRSQLYIPRGSTALYNPAGSACGFRVEKKGTRIFAFPGVPGEFKAMFDEHCRAELLRSDAVLLRKRIFTFGLMESRQRELLRDFVAPDPFRFSSLPSESGVAIALEAFVNTAEAEEKTRLLEKTWADLLSRLPEDAVVDKEGATLSETVFQLLKKHRATVSVAESCTAGALGYLITETPGSSAIFKRGFLTYSNTAKGTMLGISEDTLANFGAVSAEVAVAMARSCVQRANSDYGVSITGIAGPDGGSIEKPVGLVFISVASPKRTEIHRFQFRGSRKSIRWQSAYTALNQLRLFILKDL